MEIFLQDFRYGMRSLWSRKGFSLVVVLTLGLATGVNTTLFSLASTVLFATLPFEDPGGMVFLWSRNESLKRVREPSSYPDFADLRREVESFQDLAAWAPARRALTGLAEPVTVSGARVSAQFFPVLGVSLARGRFFREDEDRPEASPVVLLSHGAWQRRFGSDPRILGRTLQLDGESHTIIGVLTAQLEGGPFAEVEVFTPLRNHRLEAKRDERVFMIVGRLEPGTSFEEAALEVDSAARRLSEAHPDTNAGWSLYAVPFIEALMGPNVGTISLLLTMTVGFVLAIGCANVAHLLLARAAGRSRETAIRSALGATRIRLLSQFLTEGLVLSMLGSACGLAFAYWTLGALETATRERVPLFTLVHIDATALTFAMAMAFVTPLLFGLVPGLELSRRRLGERGVSRRYGRSRQFLIAGEVAMALVLLVATGLAVASMKALREIDLGFRAANVLTLNLEVPPWRYPSEERVRQFFEDVLASAESLPGARVASLSSHRPIEGSGPGGSFLIAGRPEPESHAVPRAATVIVSPRFFSTLGTPLLEGRDFSESDTELSPAVAILSRASRERYWPDESPLGARILPGPGEGGTDERWVEVVGVVSDLRNPDADQPPEPQLYLPFAQTPQRAMSLLLRVDGEPLALTTPLRRAIWDIDPNQPIDDVRTMDQIVYDDLASVFALVGLMGYFTLVALGLAIAGIYAVVSHSVSERSHEIAIRMALGGQARQVLAMVLGQGLFPVAAGLLVGGAVSLGFSRFTASLVFYGISPTDPKTYLAVTLLLGFVAFAASLVPALRACRTDPIAALRRD